MGETTAIYSYRNLFHQYYYEIREEGLYFKSSRHSAKQEFTFPFDVVACDATYYTHRSKLAFWLMVVFVFFFLFGFVLVFTEENVDWRNFLIWGPGAVIMTAWYFLSRQNFLIFEGPGGARFSIRFPVRHMEKVKAFVEELEKAKLNYLEEKIKEYLPILGRDRVNARIIELRENAIINKSGYERLMKKADALETPDIMGFNKSKMQSPDKKGEINCFQ